MYRRFNGQFVPERNLWTAHLCPGEGLARESLYKYGYTVLPHTYTDTKAQTTGYTGKSNVGRTP